MNVEILNREIFNLIWFSWRRQVNHNGDNKDTVYIVTSLNDLFDYFLCKIKLKFSIPGWQQFVNQKFESQDSGTVRRSTDSWTIFQSQNRNQVQRLQQMTLQLRIQLIW